MAIDRTKINPADNTPVNDIELTEQEILNKTLDKDYNVLAVEVLGLGPDGRLKRLATDLSGGLNVDINPAIEATLAEISAKLTSTTQSSYFAFYGSTSDDNYDYIAKQSADGKWYIMRISKTTGEATYAVGDADLATAWANFATQDYDVYANHHPS